MTRGYWLARLIVCTWVLQLPLFGWLEADSLVARFVIDGGPLGPVFLALLGGMAILGMADVAFNDMGSTALLACCRHQRHLGYMLTAIVLVLLSGVIYAHAGTVTVFLTSFWLPALFCALIAPIDLSIRHRVPA